MSTQKPRNTPVFTTHPARRGTVTFCVHVPVVDVELDEALQINVSAQLLCFTVVLKLEFVAHVLAKRSETKVKVQKKRKVSAGTVSLSVSDP